MIKNQFDLDYYISILYNNDPSTEKTDGHRQV
jgi:hypothetical protein